MSAPAGREELDLFDYEHLRNLAGYVARGVRRHRVLAVVTFLGVAGVGLALTALWPRTWHAESRLLANQNELIRALGNPRSSLPTEDPTRAAREIVFAHDNLVSLIKQTQLMAHWKANRPALVKVKDQLARLVSGVLTPEEELDAMVGTLEKRLKVETDQQTVTISIDWPDAQMAFQLVEAAQQNFLETRHLTEMSAISEALSILEMHAAGVQTSVDDALHELERVREQRRRGGSAGAASPSLPAETATPVAPPSPDDAPQGAPRATEQELAQLKFLLNAKRRALADLEEFRVRRVTELTQQLTEHKIQYADQHPVVVDTKQRIDALKQDSPQMTAVKADIDALLAEYKRKGGVSPDSPVEPVQRAATPQRRTQQTQQALSLAELSEDPLVEFSRNNLRVAAAKYEELMMRIDGARIEQDTARAAFKYRYSVVRPASVPRKPTAPNAAGLGLTALALALFCALFVGAAKDWLGGAIVEPWQVERHLGLKVLTRAKAP